MAATYALPSAALPHAHQHRMNSHSHSHSQSQTSLHSWRASMSSDQLPASFEDAGHEEAPIDHHHAHGHSHSHSHDHSHDPIHNLRNSRHISHNRMGSNASFGSLGSNTSITRDRPSSMNLDVMDGWKLEKTISGKSVIAPGPDSASTPYSPPRQINKADFSIDQSNQRSWFTNALLPYTAKLPILHAIMTEKDSRRIFYFMSYVFLGC